MANQMIIGIKVNHFAENAAEVQKILSEFGCSIRTRLGLHEAREDLCDPNGLILLEFIGGPEKADAITAKLTGLKGIEVKRMEF